jgi:hypothetical protein
MIQGCLTVWVFSAIALSGIPAFSQDSAQGMTTDVGVGVTMQKYTEIESQLSQGMPMVLEKIQETANLVKQNKFAEGREFLKAALEEARSDERIFTKDSHFKEIADYVDKMEDALTLADQAMARGQRKAALDQLTKAYRMTKVIAESPVLKIVAAEIAVGQADRMIAAKDYNSAGIFLQRAIDNITQIQQDPRVNTPELNQLKNNIIITQKQVTLGQMQDERRLRNFYPGFAAARVNTLNTYYDVWTRSSAPWQLY